MTTPAAVIVDAAVYAQAVEDAVKASATYYAGGTSGFPVPLRSRGEVVDGPTAEPSDLPEAAVNDQVRSVDEAGVRRGEEQSRRRDFLAGPEPPRGLSEMICSRNSGDTVLKSAVSIEPGLMTFTRILRSFSSAAQARASDRTAALNSRPTRCASRWRHRAPRRWLTTSSPRRKEQPGAAGRSSVRGQRRGQCPRASPIAHGDDRPAEAPWSLSPRGDRPPHATARGPGWSPPSSRGFFVPAARFLLPPPGARRLPLYVGLPIAQGRLHLGTPGKHQRRARVEGDAYRCECLGVDRRLTGAGITGIARVGTSTDLPANAMTSGEAVGGEAHRNGDLRRSLSGSRRAEPARHRRWWNALVRPRRTGG
ncbi:hypothetical protein SALBM311S_07378 [Streptomyces alboniger]